MLTVYLIDGTGTVPDGTTVVTDVEQIQTAGVYDLRFVKDGNMTAMANVRLRQDLLVRAKKMKGDITLYMPLPAGRLIGNMFTFLPDVVYIYYRHELSCYRNKFGKSSIQPKLMQWLNGDIR